MRDVCCCKKPSHKNGEACRKGRKSEKSPHTRVSFGVWRTRRGLCMSAMVRVKSESTIREQKAKVRSRRGKKNVLAELQIRISGFDGESPHPKISCSKPTNHYQGFCKLLCYEILVGENKGMKWTTRPLLVQSVREEVFFLKAPGCRCLLKGTGWGGGGTQQPLKSAREPLPASMLGYPPLPPPHGHPTLRLAGKK